MYRISHNDAIKLERQVRRLYKCERGDISGMADADNFEGNPIQAVILIVAYVYAHQLEKEPKMYEEFLRTYEDIFEHPEANDITEEVVHKFVDEIKTIVDHYIQR